MIKKFVSCVLLIVFVFLLVSCSDHTYGHAELTIDLPGDYTEIKLESFDVAYTNDISIVGITRISFNAGFNSGIPETFKPREFAEFYMQKLGRDCEIFSIGDAAYYEYSDTIDGEKQSYIASFYRTKHAYFIIMYVCPEEIYEVMKPQFLIYAKSVTAE